MDGIDDGNGNIIYFKGGKMTGGSNIDNIKEMYSREKKYIDALNKIREQIQEALKLRLELVSPKLIGLMDYIGNVLGE